MSDEEKDENGLTAAQRATIAARVAAMQARFAAFSERQAQSKLEDLLDAVEGLHQDEGELALDLCGAYTAR